MTGLSIRGLTLADSPRGRAVVEDVSFSAQSGAVTAILGPPGAGKTMLLAGIAGLRKPLRGAVFVNGTDVTMRREGRRGIVLLPPGADLGADRGVASALRRVAGRTGAASVTGLLEQFGLADAADAKVGRLTHGQGYSALTAARLLGAGEVLLVDDAGTGLGDEAMDALLRWLWAQAAGGRTVVLATRDSRLALAADWLVLLRNGQVQQAGAPASLYAEPRDLDAARLTGPVNLLKGVVRQKIPGGFVWASGGRKFTQKGAGPALGAPVEFCVRPEHLSLVPADAPGNALGATVTRLVCLGGRTETRIDTVIGPLLMHTPGPAQLRRDQTVTVGWHEAAAWPLLDGGAQAQAAGSQTADAAAAAVTPRLPARV